MADPITAAKGTISIVGEMLKLAADNPDARTAGGELGKAALTVSKTINNALLPLAAVNFAFEKAREYFATRFGDELAAKVKDVPPEQIVEPKASIAGPALQGLAFSHEEVDLKELYLSVLASAMDARLTPSVHPAFVEIIRQLTSEEAKYLRVVLRVEGSIPIAEIRAQLKPSGWRLLYRHLVHFMNTSTQKQIENPRIPAMVENWIRLGLVAVEYDKHLNAETAYDWVDIAPETVRRRVERGSDDAQVTIQKGIMTPTAFGRQFAIAVGIVNHGMSAEQGLQPWPADAS